MTVYVVLIKEVGQIDIYQCQDDARRRFERANANWPAEEGFTVVLLKKWVSPPLSTIFENPTTGDNA